MTSNFAIGNTATVAPTSNAAPSVDFEQLLNGRTPVIAAALGRPNRPVSPGAVIKGWHKLLKEAVAPNAAKPAQAGKAPFIPVSDASKGTPSSALFNNNNANTWKVPGVPELTGPIDGKLQSALDSALTPRRVQAFQSLSEGQKTTALTILYAGLEAMKLPAGSAGRIDPKDMGVVVETSLQYGQQTPTALGRSAKPGSSATNTPQAPRATPDQISTSKGVPHATPGSIPTSKPVASAERRSPAAPTGRTNTPQSAREPAGGWSDQAIRKKLLALPQRREMRPVAVGRATDLMVDLLTQPGIRLANRVDANGAELTTAAPTIRRAFYVVPGTDLRTAVAEAINMPLSAVVARINGPNDAALGRRVIERVDPAHRQRVAKTLLTLSPGSATELNVYRTLDQMMNSGNPTISDAALVDRYPGSKLSEFMHSIKTAGELFKPQKTGKARTDRVEILHGMGFTDKQIEGMRAGRQVQIK